MIYAVIDTNVLVSFFLGKNPDTATKHVVRKVLEGAVTPLYDADIIAEYKEVLKRDRVFYEISLSREDSFLVTGNLKHYPIKPHVVTPAEMLDIIIPSGSGATK